MTELTEITNFNTFCVKGLHNHTHSTIWGGERADLDQSEHSGGGHGAQLSVKRETGDKMEAGSGHLSPLTGAVEIRWEFSG